MEIELITSNTKMLDKFLTGKLPAVKLLSAYFLQQCQLGNLQNTSLYAVDEHGGLISIDVESICKNAGKQNLKAKLEEGYYTLVEALREHPYLIEEKFSVFMYDQLFSLEATRLYYYALVDIAFDRNAQANREITQNQMSFNFFEEEKMEFRLVYRKKKLSLAELKNRFLAKHLHTEFRDVLAEIKQMGIKLLIPENLAMVKMYHKITGQEMGYLYPSGNAFGFVLHHNSPSISEQVFDSYHNWLANSLRPMKQAMATQEIFGAPQQKYA